MNKKVIIITIGLITIELGLVFILNNNNYNTGVPVLTLFTGLIGGLLS